MTSFYMTWCALRYTSTQPNIRDMNIGKIIRQIRESRKATLEEIAFSADTNASNLSRIERGVQGYSAETLERIADALGVTVSEIHRMAESDLVSSSKSTGKAKAIKSTDTVLSSYKALTPEHQRIVDDFMVMLLRRQRLKNNS